MEDSLFVHLLAGGSTDTKENPFVSWEERMPQLREVTLGVNKFFKLGDFLDLLPKRLTRLKLVDSVMKGQQKHHARLQCQLCQLEGTLGKRSLSLSPPFSSLY